MKRLWIRVHALPEVADIAHRVARGKTAQEAMTTRYDTDNPNAMVVVEVADEIADAVSRNAYLMAAGRVLKDGEEPPYLGEEGKE